jgi:hypothetical protein
MTETHDWEAWIDLMPGKEHTLHVSGICDFPTSGWSAELVEHEPQGINSRDFLLDLVVHERTGPVNEVLTQVPVSFTKPAEKGEYDTVSVVPEGPTGIAIKETS